MSELVEKIRKEWGENDAKRDANFSTPEDIVRFDDIQYEKDKIFNLLDVYRPKNISLTEKLPLLLNVHGGGWVYGTKETYQFYAMQLAKEGFAVVNFTYRLAPEVKYPACIEDTNSCVKWIINNSEKYGFDLNNFFATGDSAGAHILSIYTAALSNKTFAKKFPFTFIDNFNFKAICLNCGKYSFKCDVYSDQDLLSEIIQDDTEETKDLLETVSHVTSSFPPVYLMTCTKDFLREQSLLLAKALTEASVPFEYHYVKDSEIELYHCYQNNIDLEAAKKCHKDECNFFKSFIKK